jgi:hypothetical protein
MRQHRVAVARRPPSARSGERAARPIQQPAALEQPVGRVYLAGDYLGARGGMDTAAVSGYEAAHRIIAALSLAV